MLPWELIHIKDFFTSERAFFYELVQRVETLKYCNFKNTSPRTLKFLRSALIMLNNILKKFERI